MNMLLLLSNPLLVPEATVSIPETEIQFLLMVVDHTGQCVGLRKTLVWWVFPWILPHMEGLMTNAVLKVQCNK